MTEPAVPVASGDRLAVVVGSSLEPDDLGAGEWVEGPVAAGPPVPLLDLGSALVLFRHRSTDGPATPAHLVDHHRHVRALCAAGAGRVLGLASVGSLRADWAVGTVVCPDDFLAPWVAPSFHVDTAGHSVPGFHAGLRRAVLGAWPQKVMALVDGGTYAQTSGPRFETPAEVRMLATFADVVGMTLVGECVLAREAGLAYAGVCMVDNLANGLDDAPLALDDYRAAREQHRRDLASAVRSVCASLAGGTAA